MIKYTIYITATGEIVESGSTHQLNVSNLAREGCAVFLGQRLGRDYHFVDGVPVQRAMTIVDGQLVPVVQ
jgi:hypothetical protein